MYKKLEQNILQNGNKSKLHRFSIGDHISEADLFMPINGNKGMSTLHPLSEQRQIASIVERVKVTTLDTCLVNDNKKFGRLLLLMDIEGSEMMALKGASQLIRECSPTLILEVNADMLKEAGTSANELLQYLRSLDYDMYWIDERGKLVTVGIDNQLPHLSILPPHTGANYLFVKLGEDWVNEFNKS